MGFACDLEAGQDELQVEVWVVHSDVPKLILEDLKFFLNSYLLPILIKEHATSVSNLYCEDVLASTVS